MPNAAGCAAQVLACTSPRRVETAPRHRHWQRTHQSFTNQGELAFSVRANACGNKRRVTLAGNEFIRRFMLHILPTGIQRIRHYGVLADGCKKTQLARARQALNQPAPSPPAQEAAQAVMARVARIDVLTCPQCQHGPLRVVERLGGAQRLPLPGAPVPTFPAAAQARGPP
jgi:Putative transposase